MVKDNCKPTNQKSLLWIQTGITLSYSKESKESVFLEKIFVVILAVYDGEYEEKSSKVVFNVFSEDIFIVERSKVVYSGTFFDNAVVVNVGKFMVVWTFIGAAVVNTVMIFVEGL